MFVTAELWVSDTLGRKGRIAVRCGALSEIHALRLLAPDQPDPESFFEVGGLLSMGERADVRTVLHVATYIVPVCFAVSSGRPLLWICGLSHVGFYERALGRRYDFRVLRGSARADNPYPPLSLMHEETGGSEDEQIVRLSERRR